VVVKKAVVVTKTGFITEHGSSKNLVNILSCHPNVQKCTAAENISGELLGNF
jgi:hypothetical protein